MAVMPIPPLSASPGVQGLLSLSGGNQSVSLSHASHFLDTINHALKSVSSDQAQAQSAETAVASGKPGASVATALVLSDRAEIGWTGVVAVRNEAVSAYQTVMNMQI